MLFLDANKNGLRDNDEPLFKRLTNNALQRSWNRGAVLAFYGENKLTATNGTLTLCGTEFSQQLIINRQGRLRSSNQACS